MSIKDANRIFILANVICSSIFNLTCSTQIIIEKNYVKWCNCGRIAVESTRRRYNAQIFAKILIDRIYFLYVDRSKYTTS